MDLRIILSYGGFAVFLLVWLVNGVFLWLDLRLLLRGEQTFSNQAWTNPMLVVGLVGWQIIGVIGLVVHLLIYPYSEWLP